MKDKIITFLWMLASAALGMVGLLINLNIQGVFDQKDTIYIDRVDTIVERCCTAIEGFKECEE